MKSSQITKLLEQMTLEEKIAQIRAVSITDLLEDGAFSPDKAKKQLVNGIGQVSRVAGFSGLRPADAASIAASIQDFLRTTTRLGIPAILHEECLCGFQVRGATSFPQAISLASTWQPELVERVASAVREEMRAVGVHQALGPVLDLIRDPRWGRCEETFGEDSHLAARMGLAFVRGLQGEDLCAGIGATLKHLVAHGCSEGGRNEAPVHLGPRELRDVFLLPFETVVRETNVFAVMNAYHDIDGVPCAASSELLSSILRDEWGFSGIVVSDYEAVDQIRRMHFTARDKGEAAAQALDAGLDVELPATDCFGAPLIDAINSGQVKEELVDRAAFRVLRAKEALGLIDKKERRPQVDLSVIDCDTHRSLSKETASASLVLLKNDGALPLSAELPRIAVIGPNADSVRNLLGDYAFEAAYGEAVDRSAVSSILGEIEGRVGAESKILYAAGCDIGSNDNSGIDEAVRIAADADAVVLALGGRSGSEPVLRGYAEHGDTSGEGRDREQLGLPGVQEELVRAVAALGKPVVLVIVDGRPLALGEVVDQVSAILYGWLPGKHGGAAIADAIFGLVNPGGKLPVSLPRELGQIPVHYNRHASSFKWDYIFSSNRPLFPFGHGLSFTQFEYGELRLSAARVKADESLSVVLNVRNVGDRDGDEVVQLYVRDMVASVVRPVMELKSFKRVYIDAGTAVDVEFELPIEKLGFHDRTMNRIVEPGTFEIMVGSSSDDIRLRETIDVVS